MGNVDECKVLILLGGTQKNALKQSDYVHDNIFQGISLSSEKSTKKLNKLPIQQYGNSPGQEENIAIF